MSFDFNVSSSDDETVGEKGTVFGGILNESKETSVSLKPNAMDVSDDDDDESADPNNFVDGYDDYYDFDEDDDRKPSSMDSSSLEAMAFPSDFDIPPEETKNKANGDDNDDDDDDDDDEIDWEDAQEETKAPSSSIAKLKAITLDLDQDAPKETKPQAKRTKRTRSVSVFRHDKLEGNPGLQSLLGNLHKASLLAWASHAYHFSERAASATNLGLAHSLIPTAWLWKAGVSNSTSVSAVAVPTQEDIGHFVHWFVSYVGGPLDLASSSSVRPTHRANRNNSHSTTNARRVSMTRTGKRIRVNPNRSGKRPAASAASKKRKTSATFHSRLGAVSNFQLDHYCAHLSDAHRNTNNPPSPEHCPVFHDSETLVLFLSMVRSLGWRARYVVALEPISRDLDVDHPLFHNPDDENLDFSFKNNTNGNNRNVLAKFFGNVLAWGEGKKETPIAIDEEGDTIIVEEDSKPPAKKIPSAPQKYPASLYSSSTGNHHKDNSLESHCQHVCWAEILCKTTPQGGRAASKTKNSPATMQWIHVDPILGITNQPSLVEETIFTRQKEKTAATGSSSKGRRKSSNANHSKRPISYALAVEHLQSHLEKSHTANSSNDKPPVVKMTDVTRRYASSMVATMEARGIATQKVSSKPKRRKQWRDRMMGVYDSYKIEEERPDQWFSRFLDTVSKREESNRNRKKPPPSCTATREALKSKGGSREDAIALDSDESDLDRKPAAKQKSTLNDITNSTIDHEEESQLKESAQKEPLPTSKAAFKKHPLYVIRSVLNSTEVLKPEAKSHVCGMFKGELVFRRRDVETALSAKRWLYEGRKVQQSQLEHPILRTKARKPPKSKGFKALTSYGVGTSNDGSEESRLLQIQKASAPIEKTESLYGSWQTDPWSPPPVHPGDPIPVNEHHNIELELLNPGLVHVELYRVAKVAKKLGLPYAPCLLGFEGSGKPTVRGIVVHETNEELLREAHAAMHKHLKKEEKEKREKAILLRWKRLLVGVLTKDRLEREYGDKDDSGEDDNVG